MRELRYVQSCWALLIQLHISVFLFRFPLFLLSRNCGPRVTVQLHTTQFSMGSFSICSLKGCYYTLTYKLELPVNTPSFLLHPPLRSMKRAAYIYVTHICVSLPWYTCVCSYIHYGYMHHVLGILNQLFNLPQQKLFKALLTLIPTACESCVTAVIENNTSPTMAGWLQQPDKSFLCLQHSSDHVNHNGSAAFKINSS